MGHSKINKKKNETCVTSEHIPAEWCACRKCIIMPSEKENLCCRNYTNHENPQFRCLVLNKKVLELSMKTNSDWLSYRFNPEKKCQLEIHSIQTLYNVVLGCLEKSNRKVIPACIFKEIRKRYMDKNNIYTGYLDKYKEA